MLIQYISRPLVTWFLPTMGMLFSLWHATTHALHPVQADRSMAMAHRRRCDSRRSGTSPSAGWYMFSGTRRSSCPPSWPPCPCFRGCGTLASISSVSPVAIGGILANPGVFLKSARSPYRTGRRSSILPEIGSFSAIAQWPWVQARMYLSPVLAAFAAVAHGAADVRYG